WCDMGMTRVSSRTSTRRHRPTPDPVGRRVLLPVRSSIGYDADRRTARHDRLQLGLTLRDSNRLNWDSAAAQVASNGPYFAVGWKLSQRLAEVYLHTRAWAMA